MYGGGAKLGLRPSEEKVGEENLGFCCAGGVMTRKGMLGGWGRKKRQMSTSDGMKRTEEKGQKQQTMRLEIDCKI